MKKRYEKAAVVLFSLLFMFTGIGLLSAQASYVDIGLSIPLYVGVGTTDDADDDVGSVVDYAFLIPDLNYGYLFGEGQIKMGFGFRLFTIVFETMAYPQAMIRINADPFVFTGSLGGGAFLFFGLYNNILTGNCWLSELTAAYACNEWFQLGIGGTLLYIPYGNDNLEGGYGYVPYLFARFALGGSD
ncbi:hypothetical protein [Sediminispirochaeta bajacaliforniensis]|uniref:hypothetical protein n=1 Tax=Sediminispirochaeta bajacaliforniensis TaxID=148 RepID=UPI000368B4D3|nr:hypothetical protein [Sediminispirochaeta bajacaliforniensis]